jgi:peptidoglycan/xylan/chitin deacetylase (PgdA/CDA1 family)
MGKKGKQLKKFILAIVVALMVINSYGKPVLISFDGSAVLGMWRDTLQFAKDNNVKYTYFISAPYFVTRSEADAHPYWAEKEIGVPYCKMRADVDAPGIVKRWKYVKQAIQDGHEIGSHLCGHFDGSKWNYSDWVKEFNWFTWAIQDHLDYQIKGIRAPYLGTNADYYKVLKEQGYLYDSSKCFFDNGKDGPKMLHEGLAQIPIKEIKIVTTLKIKDVCTLPFDCNFDESVGKHTPAGTDVAEIFFQSLCYDYLNSPYPLQICLHFTPGTYGDYYSAMKRFVVWAKDKNPQYMTYSEYLQSVKN